MSIWSLETIPLEDNEPSSSCDYQRFSQFDDGDSKGPCDSTTSRDWLRFSQFDDSDSEGPCDSTTSIDWLTSWLNSVPDSESIPIEEDYQEQNLQREQQQEQDQQQDQQQNQQQVQELNQQQQHPVQEQQRHEENVLIQIIEN